MLSNYVVPNAPETFRYIPDFIDAETEADLLHCIYSSDNWRYLSHRRLQIWGGVPHPKGMIAEKIPEWLHAIMDKVSDLGAFGSLRANHVLINEYKPGEGIMPHHDGPLYYPVVTTVNLGGHSVLDFYKPISDDLPDASFASRYVGSALLMPRSLNMVSDKLYTYYMHGIEAREVDHLLQLKGRSASGDDVPTDGEGIKKEILNLAQIPHAEELRTPLGRQRRISITIRHVPKTRNLNISRFLIGALQRNV